jgi:hypothetical protein
MWHLDRHPNDRLTPLLCRAGVVERWTMSDWDLLIRQARRAGLLARAFALLDEAGLVDAVPPAPRQHFLAAQLVAAKHVADVEREVACITAALAGIDAPIILLKGAAYVLARLPAARGRLFGDIDIMVPAASLGAVEMALLAHGWRSTVDDVYDQTYYRRWMHELPPLRHQARLTNIDVHHTIVPPTAGLAVAATRLFDAAQPIAGDAKLRRLAPVDLVLHGAVHLFNDGEFVHGLRDLDDLNRLLRYFGTDAGFWVALLARAAEFRLERPLYFALRYAAAILETPVPSSVSVRARPGPVGRLIMDALFRRALRPPHATCATDFSGLAAALLYGRAHYLRMPLRLLLPHLARKAMARGPTAAPA